MGVPIDAAGDPQQLGWQAMRPHRRFHKHGWPQESLQQPIEQRRRNQLRQSSKQLLQQFVSQHGGRQVSVMTTGTTRQRLTHTV
jgi:hypothetical protein